MPRVITALLCSLAAVAATAAPAPLPRPWVSGWEKPVNPGGKSRFDRAGDKLTLTVPGGTHADDPPRLLRPVRGDFVAEVRVAGFPPHPSERGYRQAGLLFTDGKTCVRLEWVAAPETNQQLYRLWARTRTLAWTVGGRPGVWHVLKRSPPGTVAHLRLERRGDEVRVACSGDGKAWTTADVDLSVALKAKLLPAVQVGVFAESTGPGEFRVRFDRFRLSRPTK